MSRRFLFFWKTKAKSKKKGEHEDSPVSTNNSPHYSLIGWRQRRSFSRTVSWYIHLGTGSRTIIIMVMHAPSRIIWITFSYAWKCPQSYATQILSWFKPEREFSWHWGKEYIFIPDKRPDMQMNFVDFVCTMTQFLNMGQSVCYWKELEDSDKVHRHR